MKDIYVDRRAYVMKPAPGIDYCTDMIETPLNIRHFRPVCRIMVSELDLGLCETPEYDTVKFFIDTKCGCNHEVVPGDAFLMPDGTIYIVVRIDDIREARRYTSLNTQSLIDFPGDDSLCLMEYACSDKTVIDWVSRCYPKIIRNTP